MISLRTKRGYSCSFFPEKRTKNLVALKTRFFIRAFIWLPVLLARLILFHVLLLSSVVPDRVLSMHETGRSRCSDSLARQSCAYSRWFYSYIHYSISYFPKLIGAKNHASPGFACVRMRTAQHRGRGRKTRNSLRTRRGEFVLLFSLPKK